jgi:hypothetical protein
MSIESSQTNDDGLKEASGETDRNGWSEALAASRASRREITGFFPATKLIVYGTGSRNQTNPPCQEFSCPLAAAEIKTPFRRGHDT